MENIDHKSLPKVLEVDGELYFSPAAYLDEFADECGETIESLSAFRHVPVAYVEDILEGRILIKKDIEYLEKMTGVSKKTWRNLDETWQKGKAKYLYRNNNKK